MLKYFCSYYVYPNFYYLDLILSLISICKTRFWPQDGRQSEKALFYLQLTLTREKVYT